MMHAPSSFAALKTLAHDGLTWWLGELQGLLPTRWRGTAARDTVSDVHLKPGEIVIERRFGDAHGDRWVESRPLEALDESGWAELDALTDGTKVRLWLHPPDVHGRVVPLPEGARGHVRQAVQLQLADIAPVDPAELVVEVAPVRTTDGLAADVVMARRARIDAVVQQFEASARPMPPLFAAGTQGPIRLRRGSDHASLHLSLPQRWVLIAILALLASIPVSTLGLGAWLSTRAEARITALQPAAAARKAAEARARRDQAQAETMAALVKSANISELMGALESRLPESAWLKSIERAADGSLIIEVEARDPDLVLAALNDRTLLPNFQVIAQEPASDGRISIRIRAGA